MDRSETPIQYSMQAKVYFSFFFSFPLVNLVTLLRLAPEKEAGTQREGLHVQKRGGGTGRSAIAVQHNKDVGKKHLSKAQECIDERDREGRREVQYTGSDKAEVHSLHLCSEYSSTTKKNTSSCQVCLLFVQSYSKPSFRGTSQRDGSRSKIRGEEQMKKQNG